MVSKEIDKRTLHVYLDAVSNSEERLRDYYRHLQESGSEISELFRRQYGGARRLKDLLQRHVDGGRRIALSLNDEEANLMAACLVDALPEVDFRLAGRQTDSAERADLEAHREFLIREAQSLMNEPLQPILCLDPSSRSTPSVRAVQSRVPSGTTMPLGQLRLGDGPAPAGAPMQGHAPSHAQGHAQGHAPGQAQGHGHAAGPGPGPGGYQHNLYPGAGGAAGGGYANPAGGAPMHGGPAPGQAPAGYGAHGHGHGAGYQQGYSGHPFQGQAPGPAYPAGGVGYPSQPQFQQAQPGYGHAVPPAGAPGYDPRAGMPHPGQEAMHGGGHPGAGLNLVRNHYQAMDGCRPPGPAAAAPEVERSEPRPIEVSDFLFDPNLIRDHRVRAQVRLDLQDFVRATDNDDMRLSLVHLGSLLEGLLLDYGLRDRKQHSLGDGPDLWDFHALAINVLGQSLSAEQEPILGILHACRRLLRPSCQVVHPIVTTAKMVGDARSFVVWALHQLGFVEATPNAAPDVSTSSALWRASSRDS